MSRPAVLVGRVATPGRTSGLASLLAWLRGDAGKPVVEAGALRPSWPGAPVGATLVVDGLEPWIDAGAGRFLARRRDLDVVAVLGRTPATDWPEYLAADARNALERLMHACSRVLVGGEAAAGRLRRVMPPSATARLVAHDAIPSGLAGAAATPIEAGLPPYMLAAGPSEARANTPLLLHLWRNALAEGIAMPRLILLGGRGTQVEEVAPLLDWNEALRPHVAEAPPLPAEALATLVAGTRALLAPDFCAPDAPLLRDAASLGCPVIAAGTSEARELGIAAPLSPLDGPGWRTAILAAAVRPPAPRRAVLPGWPALLAHFGTVAPP